MPAPTGTKIAKITVDFSNVSDSRRADHVPPGDYLAQATDCQLKTKKDDDSRRYLNWLLEIVEPTEFRGKKIYFITSLVEENLWNLRNFLVDMLGEDKVPKRAVEIPLQKIVQAKRQVGISVDDDEYNNQIKSKVVGTFPKSAWTAMKNGASIEDEETDTTESQATSTEDDEDLDEIDIDEDL